MALAHWLLISEAEQLFEAATELQRAAPRGRRSRQNCTASQGTRCARNLCLVGRSLARGTRGSCARSHHVAVELARAAVVMMSGLCLVASVSCAILDWAL